MGVSLHVWLAYFRAFTVFIMEEECVCACMCLYVCRAFTVFVMEEECVCIRVFVCVLLRFDPRASPLLDH